MKKFLRSFIAACLLVMMLSSATAEVLLPGRKTDGKSALFSRDFTSALFGADNLHAELHPAYLTLYWSPDSSSLCDGYVVYKAGRSAQMPSVLPMGWYTIKDGQYWYPTELIAKTTDTKVKVYLDDPGTYFLEHETGRT